MKLENHSCPCHRCFLVGWARNPAPDPPLMAPRQTHGRNDRRARLPEGRTTLCLWLDSQHVRACCPVRVTSTSRVRHDIFP
ncbi:hypothetical protein K438DRAFT_1801992 [Mycena galopus ATCC 62051]|nr:hypothetical protein K438DRAFT_1801992 [Mycena galopus ATCC 62051]